MDKSRDFYASIALGVGSLRAVGLHMIDTQYVLRRTRFRYSNPLHILLSKCDYDPKAVVARSIG